MKIKYINKKNIISLSITLLLGCFLLSQIDYRNISGLFDEINYVYILISFIVYFFLTFIRALRIKTLINCNNNKSNMKDLTAIVMVNSLVMCLLPYRTGEISLPILLKKYSGVESKEGFLMLLYLRVIDTLVLLIFFLIAASLFSGSIIQLQGIAHLFVLILVIFIALILLKGDKILLGLGDFFKNINNSKISSKMAESIYKLKSVYKFYKNKTKTIFILSILIFTFLIFVSGFVLKAYPIDLSYVDITIISLIVVGVMSLPINGIAGIGSVELGISSYLISIGVGNDLSISVAFSYHFIYLIFVIFFGGLSYLYLRQRND